MSSHNSYNQSTCRLWNVLQQLKTPFLCSKLPLWCCESICLLIMQGAFSNYYLTRCFFLLFLGQSPQMSYLTKGRMLHRVGIFCKGLILENASSHVNVEQNPPVILHPAPPTHSTALCAVSRPHLAQAPI